MGTTASAYKQVITKDYTVLCLAVGMLSLIGAFFWQPLGVIFWVCVFTAFDHLLFLDVLTKVPKEIPHVPEAAYRIAQGSIHILMLVVTYLVTQSWQVCLATQIIWWTLGCDVLYYIIGKHEFDQTWTWVRWSVWFFKKEVSNVLVIIGSIIGVITAILVLVFFGV